MTALTPCSRCDDREDVGVGGGELVADDRADSFLAWILFVFERLFRLGLQLLDALNGGKLLGHRAAEFFDGLADFGSDSAVGFVRLVLAGDFLAAQLFLGLGGPEEVGRQLRASHVVEDLFALLQTFAAVDVLCAESPVETHVAVVLENGVIARLDDSGILRGIGELAIVRAQFGADGEATLCFYFFVAQFLASGLDGKIGLSLGDDFFGRVGVLDDEVAGIARHHHGLNRTLTALADFDHIGDLNEMIVQPLPAVETGGAGRLNDGLEIPVIGVTKHAGKVAARPEFVARRVGATDGFKGCDFVAHGCADGCECLNLSLCLDDGEEVGAVGGERE